MSKECSGSDLRLLHTALHGSLLRRARRTCLPALRKDVAQARRHCRCSRPPAALRFHHIFRRSPAHAQRNGWQRRRVVRR